MIGYIHIGFLRAYIIRPYSFKYLAKTIIHKAAPGEKIGSFTFSGYIEQPVSGLAVVSDKGYPFVAAGFILVILGVFITYIRKLKGMLA